MAQSDLEALIELMAKLPGLGPRSARRAVLYLVRRREGLMAPLAKAMGDAAERVKRCHQCGNLDMSDPCHICRDHTRDEHVICVVQDVGDLWAMERAAIFAGRYHVLGGTLSAIDGIGPEDLMIGKLVERASSPEVTEVIMALNATVEGQTTAHYIADQLEGAGVSLSGLAHGLPVGGELDYLDDGTITAAFNARKSL